MFFVVQGQQIDSKNNIPGECGPASVKLVDTKNPSALVKKH